MSVQPTGASEANAAFKAGGVEVSALGLVVITTGVCVCYLATQVVFLFRGGSLSASRTEFNVGVNPPGQARRSSELASEPHPVEAGD